MAITLGGSSGGGGGGSPFPTMFFQQSMTWACPVAMEALVYVIGGGGSGGRQHNYSWNTYASCGGGAGGCAVSKLTLSAQNYTFVIGAGGAGGVDNGGGSNAGGNSSMSGTGITTMTANGGGGGRSQAGGSISAVSGGTATGGNLYNNTGGGVSGTSNVNGKYRTSGGGGVGLYGPGNNGLYNMALNAPEYTSGESDAAYGGSPLHGSGIAFRANESSINEHSYLKSGGINTDGAIGVELFPGLTRMIHPSETGFGGPIDTNVVQFVKTGVRMPAINSSNGVAVLSAGPFDGGGGAASSGSVAAGSGCCGGGGGGVSGNHDPSIGAYHSGAGGAGIIIICPITMGA